MGIAQIIDGKKIAAGFRSQLAEEVAALRKKNITPCLAVILVGENAASAVYVRTKKKACEAIGITSLAHQLDAATPEKKLLALLQQLNDNPAVHGILVQLPLPTHIDEQRIICAIAPHKDIDGFHPENVGRLSLGLPGFRSCTPAGIMHLLKASAVTLVGKEAVIVGRSNIVGKPVAAMLLEEHATVSICHSKTRDVSEHVKRADILIAAVGKANFIKGAWIRDGAAVIDVGINRLPDGTIVGDVEFLEASKRASAITPVPGGVGPMTVAMLLKNVVEAARKS